MTARLAALPPIELLELRQREAVGLVEVVDEGHSSRGPFMSGPSLRAVGRPAAWNGTILVARGRPCISRSASLSD